MQNKSNLLRIWVCLNRNYFIQVTLGLVTLQGHIVNPPFSITQWEIQPEWDACFVSPEVLSSWSPASHQLGRQGFVWEGHWGFSYYTVHGPVGNKNLLQALLVFFLEKQYPVKALLSLLVPCIYLNWMYLCLNCSDFLTMAYEHKLLHYTFSLICFIEDRTSCPFFQD